MQATLEGVDELMAQFATLPAILRGRLASKMEELAAALVQKVREEKLSGGLLQTRSGDLKSSISGSVAISGPDINASVGSYGDVKYAAIQEYGGHTAAHEILPSKAKVLAFEWGGRPAFARSVQHPGSAIPGKAYLRSSLDEMREEIVAALASVAQEALDDR